MAPFVHDQLEPSLHSLSDGLIGLTATYKILSWNRAAETIFGVSQSEALGRDIVELLVAPPHSTEVVPEPLRRALDAREAGFKCKCWRSDGFPVYAECSLSTVAPTHADPELVICIRDVTQQEYRLQSLSLEGRFRGLLESAPDAMVITNRDGRVLLLNGHTERLFGYIRPELIGQPVEMLMPPRFRKHHPGHRIGYVVDPHVRPMGTGIQLFGLRKNGTEFPVDINLSPFETDEGLLVSSAIRDVTEQRRAVDRLKRREAQLAEAQAMASLGSWEWDLATDEVEWSDEMYRIHGIRPGDRAMTRRMEYGLLHPNDRDIISALIERVTGDPPNTQTEFDYSIVRPDGTARCVHGKVRLVDEGRGRRLMGTVQDVTEQKRLEELADAARKNAEHANQAKTAFLTSMSHELRTPLNAILGYSELLMLGVRGPVSSDQQDALSRIQRSGAHLLALINDVLNFAKLKALQVRFLVADVPVSEVLESAASMVEPQASAKGLAFARPPCSPTLTVHVDQEKVLQILLNLLSNAIKFTDSGGRVTLVATSFDRRRRAEDATLASRPASAPAVQFTVSDTGRGIASDQLATIFEPFVQVGQRLAGADQGTGLGLAISRDLARGMGGDLTVESTLGVGSTFTLTLPRAVSG
jgi:protein-histidine pros-kinase